MISFFLHPAIIVNSSLATSENRQDRHVILSIRWLKCIVIFIFVLIEPSFEVYRQNK